MRWSLSIVVSLGMTWALWAEPVKPPTTFNVEAIDAYLKAESAAKGHVGLSVALMVDGKVVLARGYGKAAIKGPELTPRTRFAAGSVTKQFTCACILLLQEDGKLSARDLVSKYYPGLTKANEITLYDLMAHLSGYPDYYPLDFVDQRLEKPIPLDDLIKEYAGGKLDFPPRTRWSYSNTGYILLGRVIEKVSGKSFGEFLTERILKPLEMTDSVLEPKPATPGLATGYTGFALGEPEVATPEADGWLHAAGGLYTTPTDLLKWDLALATGKVLKPESYRLMTTPCELADGRVRDYGCGLNTRLRDGDRVLSHGGAVSGFHTSNAIIPRTRSAMAVMSNTEHVDMNGISQVLLNLLVKAGQPPAPAIPKIDGPPAKEAAIAIFGQLQTGEVKRAALGADYNRYLTEARVSGARQRLGKLGAPKSVVVDGLNERGGMEVAVVKFEFATTTLRGLMYRTPDGKIQEFLITRD